MTNCHPAAGSPSEGPRSTNKAGDGGEEESESTRPLGWVLTGPGGLELTSPQRALGMFSSSILLKLKSRQQGFAEKRGSWILDNSWGQVEISQSP